MGIKDFYKYIEDVYPDAFARWHESYDHIYFDLNYALHCVVYNTYSYETLYMKLEDYVFGIISELKPRKSVVFACDGIPPTAKLILQRKRRLKMSVAEPPKVMVSTIDDILHERTEPIDPIIFTAGTEFMNSLYSHLKELDKKIRKTFGIKNVVFLDHVYDEAELKLKRHLQETLNENPEDTFVYVSNDADVVLMMCSVLNYSQIYVFSRKKGIGSRILSIDKLIEYHTERYGMSLYPNYDFMMINLLMGNDYIPKIAYTNFDIVWESYKCVLEDEPRGLVGEVGDVIVINRDFMFLLLGQFVGRIKRHFMDRMKVDMIKKPSYNAYWKGLVWCANMYHQGVCSRYDYVYAYDDSPHPMALIFNIVDVDFNKITRKLYSKQVGPIDPKLYTILVMPRCVDTKEKFKYQDFITENEDLIYRKELLTEEDINTLIKLFQQY